MPNGNLLGLGSLTCVFDAQNRLTAVKNGSETVASFVYDGQGRRISQTTATGTTFYHYAGDRVAYETDSTGTITRSFTYSGSGIPVSMTYQGQTYWYLVNSHGDVLRLADSSGTVVASYRYDAWGNILESSGPLAEMNPYRYAGYRYDSASGLYFLSARYYNPEIGRFITRDVYLGAPSNPLTLNRYAYGNGNPVNTVDDSGLSPRKETGLAGFGGGGKVPTNNARAGANAVQELYPGSKGKTFTTSVNGGEKRIIDVYIRQTNTAIEVKSGYQPATAFVRNQIAKDRDLMSQGVNVRWDSHRAQSHQGPS
jgi:RHS repeat-associated protein